MSTPKLPIWEKQYYSEEKKRLAKKLHKGNYTAKDLARWIDVARKKDRKHMAKRSEEVKSIESQFEEEASVLDIDGWYQADELNDGSPIYGFLLFARRAKMKHGETVLFGVQVEEDTVAYNEEEEVKLSKGQVIGIIESVAMEPLRELVGYRVYIKPDGVKDTPNGDMRLYKIRYSKSQKMAVPASAYLPPSKSYSGVSEKELEGLRDARNPL